MESESTVILSHSSHTPIQVSVYRDKIYVGNVGSLPESWSVKTLLGKHNSRPANPTIAGCIYLTGLIETWGRGIEKVKAECIKHGCPAPFYEVNSGEPGDLLVRIDAAPDALIEDEGAPVHGAEDTAAATTSHTTTQTTMQTTMQIGGVTQTVLDLLRAEPTISADGAAQKLQMKRDTFYYHVKILRKVVGLKHVGGTKRGRWECLSERLS